MYKYAPSWPSGASPRLLKMAHKNAKMVTTVTTKERETPEVSERARDKRIRIYIHVYPGRQ